MSGNKHRASTDLFVFTFISSHIEKRPEVATRNARPCWLTEEAGLFFCIDKRKIM